MGDGVWVGNFIDGTIIRVDSGTGEITNTIQLDEGGPEELVADGSVIWVVNPDENRVERLDTETGTITGTYGAGEYPREAAVGAGAVWVSREGDGMLTRVRP